MRNECEHIDCYRGAEVKITVPKHKRETELCNEHGAELMEWAKPYTDIPGAVVIEQIK